jgi:chromosome segregation ATPase
MDPQSTYFPRFEESTARINILDELVPVQPQVYGYPSVFESTTGVVFSADQRYYRSTVRDVHRSSYMLELLATKDSEIRKLRNELSELKKESLQLNSELEQIKDECRQGILGIPEVQQALCEYNQREILFIFVLNDMTRDLSDQLGEVEYTLRKKYAAWNIGFEYVEDRISSQQFEESQVEIFDRD